MNNHPLRYTLLASLVTSTLLLAACNSDDNDSNTSKPTPGSDTPTTPTTPTVKLPKNIILMINDGASWGTWEMGAQWKKGRSANDLEAYQQLPVRLGMTTYPLNISNTPTNEATSTLGYDASKAWDATIGTADASDTQYQAAIAGYKYLKSNYTDSAAAGTALATGHKTYNNAINYDNFGQPLEFITQIAKAQGKATGVVTSVQLSHATPSTFAAQNISRKNMTALAHDMLTNGSTDLLMGTGHPEYDGNGLSVTALDSTACAANSACANPYDTIGEAEWNALKAGTLQPSGASKPWTLIDDKATFELLADGNLAVDGPLVGIPQVRWTLQQGRDAAVVGNDPAQPSGAKLIASVPDLATMTKGALNYLGKDKDGLFIMIEGGATDWAAHANQTGRLIEEQEAFDQALAAVESWVAANSSWEETLLIVTTDHGNALPLGPNSDTVAFQAVTNNGTGNLPDVRYWTGNHTNEVVRLWARGQGSEQLTKRVRAKDAKFAEVVGHNSDGSYIDNTDVFSAIKANLVSAAQ